MPTNIELIDRTRRRVLRQQKAEMLAKRQAGVVSRRQLYAAGITRSEVRAHVRARRWRRIGRQCIVVHTGPLTRRATHWIALFEAGPRAYLDAGSSLIEGGLTNYRVAAVRVSVPRGAKIWRAKGVNIRQTRRFAPDDVVETGIPRSRNAVAAVREAMWTTSNRAAALVLTMVVQQGLATPQELGEAMLRVRRDKRRRFIHAVILDLLGGVRSLGELDVAAECRRRGLPEPSRQVVRRGKHGKYYLDVYWDEWGVVLEVDGIHHSWAANVVGDALRHNDVALTGNVVLRLPLLGLRVDPDAFFGQVEQALVDAGCPLRRRTA